MARPEPLGAGLIETPTGAMCLALSVVGRNSGLGSLSRLHGSFHNAFDEVAFLLLVPFVSAGINVLNAVHQRLIFGGFLFRHL